MEIKEKKKFESKQLPKLGKERLTMFNGAIITIRETNIKFDARIHATKLEKISVKNLNKDDFVK